MEFVCKHIHKSFLVQAKFLHIATVCKLLNIKTREDKIFL